ncbi:hypothetical protein [Thermotoga caldifontis]|uniref:hypothetical protein n=1 Tax=Thermotoga caldifontis TaxID=1508419 RepID=UPI0005974FF7|nr:hypothetical protein [Thermotoga caldifontis]
MRKTFTIIVFLISKLSFGLSGIEHTYMSRMITDVLKVPAKYEQLFDFHRAIDTVPGCSAPGGWFHREQWGHDVSSLERLLFDNRFDLSPSQKKIAWAVHILEDSNTKMGVSPESVIKARRILAGEYFKLSTLRTIEYTGMLSFFDFIYQVAVLGSNVKTATISTLKKYGLTVGVSISVNFIASKIYPYVYSQSSKFMSFLPSGLLGPLVYLTVDIALRSIASGSFLKALLSPQTLASAFFTALLFVPYGQIIAPVVTAVIWMFDLFKTDSIQVFNDTFDKKYNEYLLKQAEMSVR